MANEKHRVIFSGIFLLVIHFEFVQFLNIPIRNKKNPKLKKSYVVYKLEVIRLFFRKIKVISCKSKMSQHESITNFK